ncbi:L-threonylcarbamoyladenylate synthase [Marinimicrobium sp. ABcell2]|uniref:L-threonylcarbamoyladenylate synthase n=1 Tax=Marinimicrobium sp. ABcell2 TaxID=3069751 RepID=UPI0027B72C1F|nr:Sua5/YciO/YrdC/YwlC family protein [Marinimicrobium sp. ABcell2]MDQ2077071.1 Sua5/YciO/YrdC/YwlC family protein [Marinimicrobium sp. ABcell2]
MVNWAYNPRVTRAARLMQGGGVVAYPTEAVWGLGCDPSNPEAVFRLLALKDRSPQKGLILLAANIDQLEPLLSGLDDLQRQRLRRTWPGPTTWLVPHHGKVPSWISGRFDSVAVRVTDHPIAAGLSQAFGGPIVSTSANPQGREPAGNPLRLRQYFPGELDDIVPGPLGGRCQPSEIRDLLTGEVLRAG